MKRVILIGIAALLISFVAYANLRHVNPSAMMEPIDVRTFQVAPKGQEPITILKSLPAAYPDIRAISIAPDSTTIGVTYAYQRLNENDLTAILSFDGAFTITKQVFANNGKSCPVHGALAFWDHALNAVRFVP